MKERLLVFLGNWSAEVVKYLIPAFFAYLFWRRQYLVQRENEQIVKRYLEHGIDILIERIEHALGIFRENFAHSLRILKIFKEKQATGIKLSSDDYSPLRFLRMKQESLYSLPFYKLFSLTGEDGRIFYEQAQHLFILVEESTNFYEYDLCIAIKEFVEGDKIRAAATEIFDEYLKRIENFNSRSEKFYALIGELQKIAYILETNAMSYKLLIDFHDRKEIKESIGRIKAHFDQRDNDGPGTNNPLT
ncbi:hypothetical protein BU251_07040 [Candidatus Velamenicoccus archaeovorus]|uniref:Uncharacterized protein n=1 Tax=Velamenicoccus archaeovorus TaxID=1930593 RepID=A0A410P5M3_VELA1|nr:hypothetical protein [Candidatus Velamenicoccus archaeovorus]QAT17485.1 hypothetical protein BU251_07040 [Candidatus Velamenicoccus archaeovorus]